MTAKTTAAPPKETAAARGTPAKTSTSTANSTATDDRSAPPNGVTPLPLRWAKDLIDAAEGPIPAYGSAEFIALPNCAEKVASAVLAAERDRTRNYTCPDVWTFSSKRTRAIAEARRPRPGDHPGGPVQWTGDAS